MQLLRLLSAPTALLVVLAASSPAGSAPLEGVPFADGTIAPFEASVDIGPVEQGGEVVIDPVRQTVRISGDNGNFPRDGDRQHYLWRRMKGDFLVRARIEIEFEGRIVAGDCRIGWDVRSNLDPGSPRVFGGMEIQAGGVLRFRAEPGGVSESYQLKVAGPEVVQLERRGGVYTLSAARFGAPFQETSVSHVDLGDEVYVGLSVCSRRAGSDIEAAEFSNVRIIVPASESFVPYRDYLGSNLEILDVETGRRRIVLRHPGSIQAPNWTRDGSRLIVNGDGRLWTVDLDSSTPELNELETGFAVHNNNDHVLSWDGSRIGISHHDPDDEGRSTIYTLPIAGSQNPRRITAVGAGHSYLHGFWPDDRSLVFTGFRDEKFDVLRIDLRTGTETKITDTPALDDGAEVDPSGRFVYFNSNRTGTMQIWRAWADGSDPEQLTFDRRNDWFPHLSPDGRELVFLSYPEEVDSGDHPFYRRVLLRRMPADGGRPSVVAYVYGGQGTINVHSWSPDGSRLAFVSNSGSLP